jgi:hypothetical protein
MLGSAFVINFMLIAGYQNWNGGTSVGPRYLTPFFPFLFAALVVPLTWGRPVKILFAIVALLSIYANADAALRRARYWGASPLVHSGEAVVKKIDKAF